jgi:hypothetical protein
MRIAAVTSLVALAVSAAGAVQDSNESRASGPNNWPGIVITSPRIGEKVDFSKPVTIKWQRVSLVLYLIFDKDNEGVNGNI